MFSGKKVVLTKPQIQDADVLQSWYLNKEFRQLYDGYTGNSLEMIMEEIRNGSDISDPHATRVNFIVSTKQKASRSASLPSRTSTGRMAMPAFLWASPTRPAVSDGMESIS